VPDPPRVTPSPDRDDLLTVSEVARTSRSSVDTVRRHIRKGALPVVYLGPFRRLRIRRADFQRYLRAG
jgi:excisionase family DNA binding protein